MDLRSENVKKFWEMFDKGEVSKGKEADATVVSATAEKDAELELMRKSKKEQRENFQMMKDGKLENTNKKLTKIKLFMSKKPQIVYFKKW